jgi:hypothetical protein
MTSVLLILLLSSCTRFGCRPLRIASTICDVSSVSRSSRFMKLAGEALGFDDLSYRTLSG